MILDVGAEGFCSRSRLPKINERPHVKVSLRIDEMKTARGRKRNCSLLAGKVVRSKEVRPEHNQMRGSKDSQDQPKFVISDQRLLHSDSGIGKIQKQIRQEISPHKKECGEHDSADYKIDIARQNRLYEQWPDSRPAHKDLYEQ